MYKVVTINENKFKQQQQQQQQKNLFLTILNQPTGSKLNELYTQGLRRPGAPYVGRLYVFHMNKHDP